MSEEVAQSARFGLVALVGRPNVGKSTLMNRLVGQKLSIVTRRPQTTRHRILGVLTLPEAQVAFVDTPGMHLNRRGALNQYMNRTAEGALDDMDLVLFMVEAGRWTDEDANVLARIKDHGARAALVVNKMDRLKSRTQLLPYLQQRAGDHNYSEVIPISAERGDNVDRLLETLVPYMPEGPAQFPPDQVTDRSVRFLSAEAVREKLTRRLGDELPYGLGVEIEEFEELPHVTRIGAVIWLEKTSHKPIVIGKKGLLLKDVGIEARVDLEQLLEKKIYLRLWVKVREGWSDSERLLQRLGYHD